MYSAELHDEATVRALAEEMLEALREIVEHCSEPPTVHTTRKGGKGTVNPGTSYQGIMAIRALLSGRG